MEIVIPTLTRELAPGERVLWYGRPLRGLRLEHGSFARIAFGFVFFSFSIFWINAVLNHPPSEDAGVGKSLFPLFGVPFALIGLYLFIGHFFWHALRRRYTEYAVTNRRVIVRSGLRGKMVKSINYHKIPVLTLIERGDGSGSIQFGETKDLSDAEGGQYVATRIDTLANVRSVYELIRRATDSATPT